MSFLKCFNFNGQLTLPGVSWVLAMELGIPKPNPRRRKKKRNIFENVRAGVLVGKFH